MCSARSTKKGCDASAKAILRSLVNCVLKPPAARPVEPVAGGCGSKTTTSRRPRSASALASDTPAIPPPRMVIILSSPLSRLCQETCVNTATSSPSMRCCGIFAYLTQLLVIAEIGVRCLDRWEAGKPLQRGNDRLYKIRRLLPLYALRLGRPELCDHSGTF